MGTPHILFSYHRERVNTGTPFILVHMNQIRTRHHSDVILLLPLPPGAYLLDPAQIPFLFLQWRLVQVFINRFIVS